MGVSKTMKNVKEVKVIRPNDFSQDAYLERRKNYKDNFDKFLDEKKRMDGERDNSKVKR